MSDFGNQTLSVRVMKGEGPCTKPTSIAISKPVAEALKVKIGDPIQVTGSRTTVATVESIEPIKESVAYLGRTTRPNAGAHWDEKVQVSRLIVKEAAKNVVVGPPEAGATLDVDSWALKGILVGNCVAVGENARARVCVLKDMKLKHIRSLEVLSFVHKHPGSSIVEVAEGLGVSYKTAQRYLRELRGRGKLDVKLGDRDNVQRFCPNDSVKVNPVLLDLEEIIKGMLEEAE